MLQAEALIRHVLHTEPAESWEAFFLQAAQALWILKRMGEG